MRTRRLLVRHVGRNVAPVLTVLLGVDIGIALGGTLFVETVFNIPGLGYTGINAIQTLDYPLVTGVITFAAIVAVVANTAGGPAPRLPRPTRPRRARPDRSTTRPTIPATPTTTERAPTATTTTNQPQPRGEPPMQTRRQPSTMADARPKRPATAVVLTTLTLLAGVRRARLDSPAATTRRRHDAAAAPTTGGTEHAPAGGGAAPTGEIKVGMAKGDIDTLDPNRWYFAATWGLANGLCTTLVRYDDKAGDDGVKIVPGLADMPTVSADGLPVHVQAQATAKFANGDPITPDDIKYTFERLMAPDVDTGTGGYFFALAGQDDYTTARPPTSRASRRRPTP